MEARQKNDGTVACESDQCSVNLPSGYTYQRGNGVIFVKEVVCAATVKKWLDDLAESSKVTWRVRNTWPEGKANLYKQRLRCQHARVVKNLKGQRTSKATGCEALLTIKVRRLVKRPSGNPANRPPPGWQTSVQFVGSHNHSTSSAAVLKYRDMSTETRDYLIGLFRQGHSPSSALHCLKAELRTQHGDEYDAVAADGRYVPSLSIVDKLFNKFIKQHGSVLSTEQLPASITGSKSDAQFMDRVVDNAESAITPFSSRMPLPVITTPTASTCGDGLNTTVHVSDADESASCDVSSGVENAAETADLLHQVDKLFARIKHGLMNNPSAFKPAVAKLLSNARLFAQTDTGLIKACTTFAQSSGFPTSARPKRRYRVQTGIKPCTAVGRRRVKSSGKLESVAERPIGIKQVSDRVVGNAYTTFGVVSTAKSPAEGSTQSAAVVSNTGLDEIKRQSNGALTFSHQELYCPFTWQLNN